MVTNPPWPKGHHPGEARVGVQRRCSERVSGKGDGVEESEVGAKAELVAGGWRMAAT